MDRWISEKKTLGRPWEFFQGAALLHPLLKLTASLPLKMDGWNTTASLPLKMDGWKTILSFWDSAHFQVRTVSSREGKGGISPSGRPLI